MLRGCDLPIPVAAQQESLGGVLATLMSASVQNLQHIMAAHIESCYEHSKRMETRSLKPIRFEQEHGSIQEL